MVGIHARTGREKIFARNVAHVLNDETQRKYIQVCLTVFCTIMSMSAEVVTNISLLAECYGWIDREQLPFTLFCNDAWYHHVWSDEARWTTAPFGYCTSTAFLLIQPHCTNARQNIMPERP